MNWIWIERKSPKAIRAKEKESVKRDRWITKLWFQNNHIVLSLRSLDLSSFQSSVSRHMIFYLFETILVVWIVSVYIRQTLTNECTDKLLCISPLLTLIPTVCISIYSWNYVHARTDSIRNLDQCLRFTPHISHQILDLQMFHFNTSYLHLKPHKSYRQYAMPFDSIAKCSFLCRLSTIHTPFTPCPVI